MANATTVVVPKGTPVAPEVTSWALADLNDYIRFDGYKLEVDAKAHAEFRKAVRKNPGGFKEDYVLLNAEMPQEPEKPRLEWLHVPGKPHDLAIADVPFLRVTPPKPALEGRDVYGRILLPKNRETPPRVQMQLDPELVALDDENYVSTQNGQVRIEGQRLRFSPNYLVDEVGKPEFAKIEWPCGVVVKGDLEGMLQWIIHGDLELSGHWSAPDVTVFGNVRARSGIQTNMQGVIRVHGNVEAPFLQMTRMGVVGNLTVDSAILQSEVRVGGELRMRGNPGAIMGSTVDVFGNIVARKVGSDKGRRTMIRIHDDPDVPQTRVSMVGMLSAGTHMSAGGRQWTVKEDGAFNSSEESSN
jgi:hypothetical protein